MRIVFVTSLVVSGLMILGLLIDAGSVIRWAVEQQRDFQNQMAMAVQSLKSGEASALLALCSAAGAYGFVHALGPGHGKYLVSGVGLGTSVSASRLMSIATASSLCQALWAIILVYGGFFLIELTASQMTFLAEDILAPMSYVAIGCVGMVLAGRGALRMFRAREQSKHAHEHSTAGSCRCCGHAPSQDQMAQVTSLREAVTLVLSVAVRPCTGAIFLLVIAWQMDIRLAGALAVLVMGLGTAALTSLVACSSVAARGVALTSIGSSANQQAVFSAAQVCVGLAIVWISGVLLSVAI